MFIWQKLEKFGKLEKIGKIWKKIGKIWKKLFNFFNINRLLKIYLYFNLFINYKKILN